MSDLSKMAGKPVVLSIGGEDYAFSPLTLDDYAELEAWLASDKMDRALKALGPNITSEERVEIVVRLSDEVSAREVSKVAQSMRGNRQLLWYSLRKRRPEITREEAAALVNLDNLEQMTALVDSLSSEKPEEDDSNPPAAE